MYTNKFIISFASSLLISFLLVLTIAAATSYEQTAADISPGVFTSGGFYFPDTLYIGTSSDPGLTSSNSAALYIDDGEANQYGTYIVSDTAQVGLYSTVSGSSSAIGLYGYSETGRGVEGTTDSTSSSIAAVYGYADEGAVGVYGYDASGSSAGVKAYSTKYDFYASGTPDYGLYVSDADSYGVYVADATTYGVYVRSSGSMGGKFIGDSYGVEGSGDYFGGYFTSTDYTGLEGVTSNTDTSSSAKYRCGVVGYNSGTGTYGMLGCASYGIYTEDNAKISGSLRVGSCSGCDVAEHFLGDGLEAGDVVILDATKVRGVTKTTTPYNKLAAGIISTDPTMTMGLEEGVPIALAGVVPTKVIGTVHVGDLLTTSSTPGYAMACNDMTKCVGAVVGKAMEENKAGKGKITALVMMG